MGFVISGQYAAPYQQGLNHHRDEEAKNLDPFLQFINIDQGSM